MFPPSLFIILTNFLLISKSYHEQLFKTALPFAVTEQSKLLHTS